MNKGIIKLLVTGVEVAMLLLAVIGECIEEGE